MAELAASEFVGVSELIVKLRTEFETEAWSGASAALSSAISGMRLALQSRMSIAETRHDLRRITVESLQLAIFTAEATEFLNALPEEAVA